MPFKSGRRATRPCYCLCCHTRINVGDEIAQFDVKTLTNVLVTSRSENDLGRAIKKFTTPKAMAWVHSRCAENKNKTRTSVLPHLK